MTSPRGRGIQRNRTPALVRDYLSGSESFPEEQEGDRQRRSTQGDYVARIHQHVKQFIQIQYPERQWPRGHSFRSLVQLLYEIGLLERLDEAPAGQTREPQFRGAGQLGTAGGFSPRRWYRLTPGMEESEAWRDPIGFYAISHPEVAKWRKPAMVGAVPPTPPEEAPPEAAPPEERRRPARRRREEAAAPPAIPEETQVERMRALAEFQATRQDLMTRGLELVSIGASAEEFRQYGAQLRVFLAQLELVYGAQPYTEAWNMLPRIDACVRDLVTISPASARWPGALGNCRALAGLVADELTLPLKPLPTAEEAAAIRQRGARRRRGPAQEGRPAGAPRARRPEEAPAEAPPEVVTIPSFTLAPQLGSPGIRGLIAHLRVLERIQGQVSVAQVQEHLIGLATSLESWVDQVEKAIQIQRAAPSLDETRLNRLREYLATIQWVQEVLGEDLAPAAAIARLATIR